MRMSTLIRGTAIKSLRLGLRVSSQPWTRFAHPSLFVLATLLVLNSLSPLTVMASDEEKRTADLTLRYVNDSVISLGDVMRRNAMRMSDYERRGRPRPTTRSEVIAFANDSLTELTEEELLIQYGHALSEQRGFRLVDHERISQMVMERSRTSGRGNSLREQAEERKYIERQQIMDLVMGYFESRAPHIAPKFMEDNYQQRQADFRRPARAKVLQIILRPSSVTERQEVKQRRLGIFRRAQDVLDQAIRQASENRIEAYTVAAADEQERLLAEAVQDIAHQATRPDLDPVSADLAQQAAKIEEQAKALRDVKMTHAELEAIRLQLVGKDAESFKTLAKQFSQGPNAIDGGDMGWVESGTYQAIFDKMAFETAVVGEVSPVFSVENNAYLLFVSERTEAHSRSFAEVVGEVESDLNREQQRSVRLVAVAMLREKASIRDIISLSVLFDQ
jgi:PPIC-type PPIASE domain